MSNAAVSVLVVDDDVDICQNLADILTDLGYQVDTAHDGPAALELARQRPYDLALLDLKMPGMDGLTLYRELRKIRAGAVALIVTAFAGPETIAEAQNAGVWRVLPKPVDFPLLLQLLGEAVDQPLVLVVDDDPDLCANLWDLLRESGYRVCVAYNEVEASKHLQDLTFRVVLIDMKLPGGDGGSVFRLVRQSNPQARTMVITGFRSEMDPIIQAVVAEGADAVCYKPFDVANLLDTLRQLSMGKDEG
jgi:CheY-like chemotaxis protein